MKLQIPNKHQTKIKQKTNEQPHSWTWREPPQWGPVTVVECVMNNATEVAAIEKSLEMEIARNLHQSKRAAAVSQPPSAEHEMTADNLGTLFRQIAKSSMSEVDDLIGELHRLRTKLEIDSDLIERAITQHSEESHGVMQLTTIIAENVKRLPTPTS